MRAWLAAVALGCTAAPRLPVARFANAPVVRVVDDRRDVPKQPAERIFLPDVFVFDGTFQRPLTRALEVPRPERALGVNALDEVPDSTWFINRIGVRDLTPDQVRNGPLTIDSPELHRPWTIHSTKVGGASLGFIIDDARGVRYLLKFDELGFPELETGTHVVVNRLLWAAGYNVPEDQIVYIKPEDLVVAPDATVKGVTGNTTRKLVRAELDRDLATVMREPDGRIRALASRWLDGKPLGGHPSEGVRGDDPNDRIPHQMRRDLRGAYAIFAWLDHLDVTEGNFLDAWVTDRADPHRHFVKHYAIDFGKSLGTMGAMGFDRRRGESYQIDLRHMLGSLATAGLIDRPWDHREHAPGFRGVASLFTAEAFDPGSWHPDSPGYIPFLTADRFDKFWGAKIVARFTRDQIRAAVEAAHFSDPRATAYITDTLVARQQATARYWFDRVNPLDHFAFEGDELCFDDLALVDRTAPPSGGAAGRAQVPPGNRTAPPSGGAAGRAQVPAGNRLAAPEATRYLVSTFDWTGRPFGERLALPAQQSGRSCTPLHLATDNRGYTIVRFVTTRSGFAHELLVHVARDPSSDTPRVIGVWRS